MISYDYDYQTHTTFFSSLPCAQLCSKRQVTNVSLGSNHQVVCFVAGELQVIENRQIIVID